MDDLRFGTRNKRGDWTPRDPIRPSPLFLSPLDLKKMLAFIPRYFLPWNILFMAIAAIYWFWLTPDIETMKTLGLGWILYLLVRNSAAVLIMFGALELRLYIRRSQGGLFKFNARFPAEHKSDVFMFNSQAFDGIVRTFGTGLPVWTAYEVLLLWSYANGYGPWSVFGDNPVWLVFFWLAMPIYHEFHFYCIHRLIHIPVLYKYIHSVHHNSVNPSPWSSLSMHPVEHLLYWSDSLIHLILPSHPLLALYNLNLTGVGAVVGHIGFDKIVAGNEKAMDTHAFAHYLHHKYFEVNYADGNVPFDWIFDTWHDGTKRGNELMNSRMAAKRARRAAKGG